MPLIPNLPRVLCGGVFLSLVRARLPTHVPPHAPIHVPAHVPTNFPAFRADPPETTCLGTRWASSPHNPTSWLTIPPVPIFARANLTLSHIFFGRCTNRTKRSRNRAFQGENEARVCIPSEAARPGTLVGSEIGACLRIGFRRRRDPECGRHGSRRRDRRGRGASCQVRARRSATPPRVVVPTGFRAPPGCLRGYH